MIPELIGSDDVTAEDKRTLGGIYVLLLGIAAVMVVGIASLPSSEPTEKQETKPYRQLNYGQSYRVTRTTTGALRYDERKEVRMAGLYDQQGFMEMVLKGRAAIVSAGDTVLLIDMNGEFMEGTWLKVRLINSQLGLKGVVWIPKEALE